MAELLHGRRALVTGASRGIGCAIATRLARDGAHVLLHYGRSATEVEAVLTAIRDAGGSGETIATDLEAPDAGARLGAAVRATLRDERLDILVANAGIAKAAPIEETTVEDFDRLFAVNVRAPFFLIRELLPALADDASVILTSSVVARTAFGRLPAYAATKGAIDSLVIHLASAFGARGIRVNAVSPGVIDTEMSSFAKSEEGRRITLAAQALQRIGQPDDVAGVVAFLASDDARWITGRSLQADGGSKL